MFHTFASAPVLSGAASAAAALPLLATPGHESAIALGSGQLSHLPALHNPSAPAMTGGDNGGPASPAAPAVATGGVSVAATPLSSVLSNVYPEWSTGERQLDTWLQLKMQSQDVFAKLAQIPVRDRRQLVTASMRKEGDIMNMTSYIMGCIRKVQSGGSAAQIRVPDTPGTVAVMGQMTPAPRMPASPQQQQAAFSPIALRSVQHGSPVSLTSGMLHLQAPHSTQTVSAHIPVPSAASVTPQPGANNELDALGSPQAEGAPEWVQQAMQNSDKPSTFVAEVLKQLPQVLRTVLEGLNNPGLQYRLCFALVLNGRAWAAPGPTMEALLRSYSMLAPGSALEAVLGKAGGSLKLVLLHCCNGIGTSHLVIHSALRILATSRPGIEVSIMENYAFEVDAAALKLQAALIQALGVTVQQVGDIALLPLLAQQCAPKWAQQKAVICFLNSWPCKNTSRAASMKDRPPGSGLHMQHSRKIWEIDHAMHVLQQMKTESHYIAHMTEYPQCGNEAEEETIDQIFGKAFVSNPSCYGGASRARNMRTAPSKLELKMYHHPIDPKAPIDGWTWSGNGAGVEDKHPQLTLRSHITVLMETELYGTRQLENWESNTLRRMQMVQESTGKVRYISRAFWLLWLGFDKTPVPEIADAQLPCLGTISLSTGGPATVETPGSSACGERRYCKNCEDLVQMLGQAWHVRSMTDVAAAWLDKIIARHCKHDSSVEWPSRPDVQPHMCGPQCEHNPRPGY